MNLTQAQATVSLHTELIRYLEQKDGFKAFEPPKATFRENTPFDRQDITIEDGQIKVEWSRYIGCGDYDTEYTYHRLEDILED